VAYDVPGGESADEPARLCLGRLFTGLNFILTAAEGGPGGPNGSGKTTLLRGCCAARSSRPRAPTGGADRLRLVYFMPDAGTGRVVDAASGAGAGGRLGHPQGRLGPRAQLGGAVPLHSEQFESAGAQPVCGNGRGC